ncbi:MAG: leucyl aminopeptidase [Candidatus Micrarchaeota archaeon]
MDFKVVGDSLTRKTDCLVVGVFESQELTGYLKKLDSALNGELKTAFSKKEFTGKKDEVFGARFLGKLSARRVLFFGLGKKKDFNSLSLRKSFGSIAGAAAFKSESLCFGVPPEANSLVKEIIEAVRVGVYSFDKYKTKEKSEVKLKTVFLATTDVKKGEAGLKAGVIFAEAQEFARNLSNEHASLATPEWIARQALSLKGVKTRVLREKELKKEKLEALLAVGAGAENKPCLIVMEYQGGKKNEKPIAFIGKGITFDSGGISLKPSQAMDEMRFDKSGACAVIALMSALHKLGVKKNVVGVCAMAENDPSGSAFKPGDIIKTASGKTIQVLNTDAEGRLVLVDAIYYAQKKFKPSTIIDFATLTGACVVALGDVCSGLLSNDEALARKVFKAGEASGERVWQLPLYEEYDDKIKSDFADVKNIGQAGMSGTQSAASFLKAFVKDGVKWAHLDIAGTAYASTKTPVFSVGATGVGVKMSLELLNLL